MPDHLLRWTTRRALLAIAAAGLLAVNHAQATALFNTRAALFVTFDSASGGTSGVDFSVGSSQPFTPIISTTDSGNAAFDNDVFPGGNSGWQLGNTYRVDVEVSGDASLPAGTADAAVLGTFNIIAQNFSTSLPSITFDFSYNYLLTGSVTPGAPGETASSFGNIALTHVVTDIIDANLDLSTTTSPHTDTLSGAGSFSLTAAQFGQENAFGAVNAQGAARAPASAPVPSAVLLMGLGLVGLAAVRTRTPARR